MKITCNREKTLAAFQLAAAVAPSRSPKPILQCVKLEVTEKGGVFMATDMEVGIRIDVPDLQVETPGSAVFPVDQFGPILRESSDEQLHIEATEQGATIKGDRSQFELPGANPHEFPAVPTFEESSYHEVSARLLKELIRRTSFATDTESNRFALGGVLLEMEADKITAVGTDGRRLAKMEGPAQSVNDHQTGDMTVIIPTRSMQLIERSLADGDAEIQVAARPNDVMVRTPRLTLYSRLVEGRFPIWRDVLPKGEFGSRVAMTVGPAFSSLKQASIVANAESRGVTFDFQSGNLTIKGSTAEIGKAQVELPISYDGEQVPVTLDHRYVLDFLKVLDPDRGFAINFRDAESMALFSTEDGYEYVVMPLSRDA